ncbi:MAG: peptidase domain-containing ABC transporter [Rhodospirillales bacterium]
MSAIAANGDALAAPTAGLSGTPFGPSQAAKAEDFSGNGALVGIDDPTDLSISLLPLLEALAWQGDPQQVAEALPHFQDAIDITAFRNVLAALGYRSRAREMPLDAVDEDDMPCLFLPNGHDAVILLGINGAGIEAFDSAQERYVEIPNGDWTGTAYFFEPVLDLGSAAEPEEGEWFTAVGERFRGLALRTLAITFVLNLLALALPLFVMATYDRAIGDASAGTAAYLAVGVAIAIAADLVLRVIRARIFSFVGARLDHIVGVEVFRKILYLPAALIERAAVGAQVVRIRDFDSIRDFFTGPAAPVLFELPFALLFIAVVAYLGGIIAFVPVAMLALAAAVWLLAMPRVGDAVARAQAAAAAKQELTVETLGGMRAIKYSGAETTWLERYRRLSADAAFRGFHAAQLSSLLETFSYVVAVVAGFATVAIGVYKVEAGEMTLGAVVASMILVWRALAPLQTGLVSLTRVSQVESGVDHLNDLMEFRRERRHAPAALADQIEGRVTFETVSIRYEPDAPPALDEAGFDIKSGKIVAILGANGAGKSTLLKLLAGIYRPDQGSVMIDGRDIRDMTAVELRRAVAYVPQTPQFFYGTIAQNLRLAQPTASDDDLRWAVRQAGALEDIEALEQGAGEWRRTGFDVRLGDRGAGQVSPGLLQRLNLARGYLKRAPIILMDEPGNGLDIKGDQSLMRALANLRGQTTVFIVTHRPSHLKMADRIIWLEYGSVRAVGRSKVVMQKTPGVI